SQKVDCDDIRIADVFDMVAGTSIGSIIALELTVPDGAKIPRPRYKAADIVEFYKKNKKDVFKKTSNWKSIKIIAKLFNMAEQEQEPAISILDPTYFFEHTQIDEEPEDPSAPKRPGLLQPAYSSEKLEELLEKKFGNNLLKDTVNNVHVLVPAYNITDKKMTYFTNKNFRDYLMKDVI
ncbi:3589_t:CDS:1, partial [Gigaspora margarita]